MSMILLLLQLNGCLETQSHPAAGHGGIEYDDEQVQSEFAVEN